MGVHTNAEKIVREYGFSPQSAHSTVHAGLTTQQQRERVDAAVSTMAELLSDEGLVRVYALLQSANATTSPRFDIGGGGKALVKGLERKLEPSKRDREVLKQIDDLKAKLKELEENVKNPPLKKLR